MSDQERNPLAEGLIEGASMAVAARVGVRTVFNLTRNPVLAIVGGVAAATAASLGVQKYLDNLANKPKP